MRLRARQSIETRALGEDTNSGAGASAGLTAETGALLCAPTLIPAWIHQCVIGGLYQKRWPLGVGAFQLCLLSYVLRLAESRPRSIALVREIICHGHVCAFRDIALSDWPSDSTEGIVVKLELRVHGGVGAGVAYSKGIRGLYVADGGVALGWHTERRSTSSAWR